MASHLFRRLPGDFLKINGQRVRKGHHLRGKPPTVARTLEQRLAELNFKDPALHYRVDIGYKQKISSRRDVTSARIAEINQLRKDPEIERKAREQSLMIDLKEAKKEWWGQSGPSHVRTVAEHYGIFEHLFGDAYFNPLVPIDVEYSLDGDLFATVHRGNLIKAREAKNEPIVKFDAKADSLWTLLLTTPDGNFVDSTKEICHWFIGNIPGSEVSKGDLLVDYMRPIPARGIGYCRYIFVLYKQNQKIDYSEYKKERPCLQLVERNWSTYDFYRKHQDDITPAGLAFYQADWDSSLTDFYRHELDTREPKYEYDFPKAHLPRQEWFPKGRAFNLYLDRYRDPKAINKEFLMKKMKTIHPFKPPPPPLKYPNAVPHPKGMPSWLRLETKKERLGWGRINEIK